MYFGLNHDFDGTILISLTVGAESKYLKLCSLGSKGKISGNGIFHPWDCLENFSMGEEPFHFGEPSNEKIET